MNFPTFPGLHPSDNKVWGRHRHLRSWRHIPRLIAVKTLFSDIYPKNVSGWVSIHPKEGVVDNFHGSKKKTWPSQEELAKPWTVLLWNVAFCCFVSQVSRLRGACPHPSLSEKKGGTANWPPKVGRRRTLEWHTQWCHSFHFFRRCREDTALDDELVASNTVQQQKCVVSTHK